LLLFGGNLSQQPTKKAVDPNKKSATTVFKLPGGRWGSMLRLFFYWLIAWLTLVAFFLSGILKSHNYLEFSPKQTVVPLLIHTFTAAIIAIVVWLLPRPKSAGAKSVTVLFLALCMVNYDTRLMGVVGIFRALLPILPQPDNDLPIISLLFIMILLGIAVLVGMFIDKLMLKHKNITSKNIAKTVAILVGFVFLGQALPAFNVLSHTMREDSYSSSAELQQAAKIHPSKDAAKPDIYYIVMEDYESNSVLKDQFNTDNSEFSDWLRSQNFNVNDNALSQYPFSAPSVASVMNLSYNNDDIKKFKNTNTQAAVLYFNMVRQAEAVKLLKAQGYEYDFLGNPYGAFNRAPLAENMYTSVDHTINIFGHLKSLHDIEMNNFLQSPYYRFSKVPISWWPIKEADSDPISFTRNQLINLDQLAKSKQQGDRFVFADILAPHLPSYLNSDCSISSNPGIDNTGEPVKQKYFGEVQCMNTEIKKVVADINKNSHGQAVVMLVSDEGQFPATMNQTFLHPSSQEGINDDIFDGSMENWSRKDLQMKYGILQAVSIPQATQDDLNQMSPVNMFRVVLNRYFGYNFNYLPNCQFGAEDGRHYWYKYFDATKKVTGSEDPACKQYE
jgi:hypothetical protein